MSAPGVRERWCGTQDAGAVELPGCIDASGCFEGVIDYAVDAVGEPERIGITAADFEDELPDAQFAAFAGLGDPAEFAWPYGVVVLTS